jgi:cytochrome c5
MRIALSGFFALAVAAATPALAQNANPLPQGDGRDIVSVACSQCHYLGTIAKIRDGAAGWRMYVDNMVLRGAQLTPPEIDNLVETRCELCHDLERVAEVKRSRAQWPAIVANMVARGATASPEEAKTISDYLAANFGN